MIAASFVAPFLVFFPFLFLAFSRFVPAIPVQGHWPWQTLPRPTLSGRDTLAPLSRT